jgi:hypothetical protein
MKALGDAKIDQSSAGREATILPDDVVWAIDIDRIELVMRGCIAVLGVAK